MRLLSLLRNREWDLSKRKQVLFIIATTVGIFDIDKNLNRVVFK